jgi:hypothetical protein
MLSAAQQAAFAAQGFVLMRQAVPEPLVTLAKAKIDDALAPIAASDACHTMSLTVFAPV